MIEIVVPRVRSPADPVIVGYRATDLDMKQRRFQGCFALTPTIDLSRYRFSAVIDWVEVVIHLTTPTTHRALQTYFGRRPYVRGFVPDGDDLSALLTYEEGPGGKDIELIATERPARTFTIRIQEPKLADVDAVLRRIAAENPLKTDIQINAIEVSVDIYAKNRSTDERQLMTAILMRHIMPKRGVIPEERGKPRFFRPDKPTKEATQFIIGKEWDPDHELWFLPRYSKDDLHPSVDSTLYFGPKDGLAMLRVMDKIVDCQNPEKGSALSLPQAARRTRVEVCLRGDRLDQYEMREWADLHRCRFQRLQGDFFSFWLPTFHNPVDLLSVIRAYRDIDRRRVFERGAMVCLDASDDASRQIRARLKQQLPGIKRRSVRPLGTGERHGHLAYTELNKRISDALSRLSIRQAYGAA